MILFLSMKLEGLGPWLRAEISLRSRKTRVALLALVDLVRDFLDLAREFGLKVEVLGVVEGCLWEGVVGRLPKAEMLSGL